MSDVLVAADPIAGDDQTKTETKTYRGASIEELLPQIRADLGPEAVIVSRREGLIGGFAGFFQKKCVEVDARAGGPRIDVYDDGEAKAAETIIEPPAVMEPHPVRNDAATREGLETPAVQRLVGEAKPFSDLLEEMASASPAPSPEAGIPAPPSPAARAYAAAESALEPGAQTELVEPEARPEPEADPTPEPKRIASLREGMVAAGLGADLAAEIVDAVVANVAPFATPSRLRTLVRNELALRLPVAPAPGPGRRHLAVVGPAGTVKTAAVARVAAAHAAAGQDVACITLEPADGGAALRAMLDGSGVKVETIAYEDLAVALLGASAQLVLIDTPAAAPSTGVTVESLGATLSAAGVDEIHLAVRAGTASPAAVEMHENLRGLEPNRILVSAAADTSYIGAAVDVAIRTSLPVHYVAETVVELAPADPRDLASRVVP
jgi:flagellar biosynthesis GTPase FlhF